MGHFKSNEWYLWFSMHFIYIFASVYAVAVGFCSVGFLANGWTSPSTFDVGSVLSFQWHSSFVLVIVFFVCLVAASIHTIYVVWCERDTADPNLPAVSCVKAFCGTTWFSALGYWGMWTLADVLSSGDRTTLTRLDFLNVFGAILAVGQMVALAMTLLGVYSKHEPVATKVK